MIRTYEISVEERLISWAQNEEMVDQYFTEHGRDCLEAADLIKRLREDAERYRWMRNKGGCPFAETRSFLGQ